MRLQYVSGCGKSMIEVRRKYVESKAYVRLKYGKSTVKYGKSTVLYGKFFWAPTVVGESPHSPGTDTFQYIRGNL